MRDEIRRYIEKNLDKYNNGLDAIYITFPDPEKDHDVAAVRVSLESISKDIIFVIKVKDGNEFSHKLIKESENKEGLHVDEIVVTEGKIIISINHHHIGYREESTITMSKDDL